MYWAQLCNAPKLIINLCKYDIGVFLILQMRKLWYKEVKGNLGGRTLLHGD